MTRHLLGWCRARFGTAMILASAAACAQQPSGAFTWPPMGTEIVVERTASGSYGPAGGTFGGPAGRIAWKLERREWKGVSVVAAVSSEDKTPLFDVTSGAAIAVLDTTGRLIWTYDPPLESGRWPLEVGKSWTTEVRMTEESFASRPVVPLRFSVRVEAYEDVTVPAGTFKAYRVVSTTPLGTMSTHWMAPSAGLIAYFAVKGIEERPPSNLLGAGRREWTLLAVNPPR